MCHSLTHSDDIIIGGKEKSFAEFVFVVYRLVIVLIVLYIDVEYPSNLFKLIASEWTAADF